MSMHYENGQETALIKLGFMGMTPEQMKLIAAQAGMGAVGGGAAGALMADDGNGLAGGLAGAATGGLLAGGLSGLSRGYDRDMARKIEGLDLDVWNPDVRKAMEATINKPHAPVTPGDALAAVPYGAAGGWGAGHSVNGMSSGEDKTASKLAFLGLNPDQLKHIALRAGGGAAAGAGAGAIAGGEDHRLSGALAGGALGGLTAGGLSAGHKLHGMAASRGVNEGVKQIMDLPPEHLEQGMRGLLNNPEVVKRIQDVRNQEHAAQQAVQQGISAGGMPRTMGGGAAAGVLPGMVGGRMQRDE
jgi:hypothetical protein